VSFLQRSNWHLKNLALIVKLTLPREGSFTHNNAPKHFTITGATELKPNEKPEDSKT
jgi:hypothetical protein